MRAACVWFEAPPSGHPATRPRARSSASSWPYAAKLLACSAVVVALTGIARGDELSDLEKAYGAYAAHDYEEAEARLRALLGAKNGALKDPERVADARMYLGAVLLSEGKKDEAAKVLEDLLLDKPDYQPDPLRVPLSALDAIVDARLRLRDKLVALQAEKVREALQLRAKADVAKQRAATRLAMLERLASEEIVVDRHSRWEALVPFGVGQFQNRQTALGWSLLTTESLLAVASAIGFGLTLYNESLAYDALETRAGTALQYEQRATEAAIVGNIFAAGFAAIAIGGVVHAQATFVGEHVHVEERKRSLPSTSLAPLVGPGGIGLSGTF